MKRSVLSKLYCIGVYVILVFSPALAQSTGEHSYIFPGVTRDMDIAIGRHGSIRLPRESQTSAVASSFPPRFH
jgi:hypothetical protein